MKTIIEFYKDLDILSAIFFWCVIIIMILLIIFTILLINKTKKIKKKIINNEEEIEDETLQIMEEKMKKTEEEYLITSEKNEEYNQTNEEIKEETDFVAEEHVMEYNNDMFVLPDIKKATEEVPEEPKREPFTMPTRPYERNVLREMDLSQTSPIGIIRKEDIDNYQKTNYINNSTVLKEESSEEPTYIENYEEENNQEIDNQEYVSEELQEEKPLFENIATEINNEEDTVENLDLPEIEEDRYEEPTYIENYEEENNQEIDNQEYVSEEIEDPPFEEYHQEDNDMSGFSMLKKQAFEETNDDNTAYIEEVSKKLAAAEIPDEVDRTEYELKQEEDAIISFKELMERKDTIDVVDEEDAVISIEELMKRKEEEEKLYNITEEEENDNFLKELKKFRNDL